MVGKMVRGNFFPLVLGIRCLIRAFCLEAWFHRPKVLQVSLGESLRCVTPCNPLCSWGLQACLPHFCLERGRSQSCLTASAPGTSDPRVVPPPQPISKAQELCGPWMPLDAPFPTSHGPWRSLMVKSVSLESGRFKSMMFWYGLTPACESGLLHLQECCDPFAVTFVDRCDPG